jgi:pilus assembly protein CpaB
MKMRGLIMLGVALVLAVVAVVLARNWLRSKEARPLAEQVQSAPQATVLVARARLDFAARIGPEHVQAVKWPADAVPPGTFKSLDELFVPGTERVVLRAIEVGEPIFAVKISGKGQRATLSALVEDDMRATSIRVTDISEVSGFIVPGDRVDVLLTRDESGGRDSMINDVLLQNIRVLAVDQIASDRHDKPVVVKAVTLEVTPVQAQKVTLAASVGTLSLALRNEANSDPAPHPTIRVSDLRGGEMVRPLPAPEARNMVRAVRPAGGGFDPLTSIKIVRAMKSSTQANVAREKLDIAAAAGKPGAAGSTVRVNDLRPGATPPIGSLPAPAKKASWTPVSEDKTGDKP